MINMYAAVIEKEGLVIVARRKQDAYLEGFWGFPGSKVEVGESPSKCLARELEEEFEEFQFEYISENLNVLRNKKQRWMNALVRKCGCSA
jgi:ADP-ribose pyrophosphatase YjhB (NUDIX family)